MFKLSWKVVVKRTLGCCRYATTSDYKSAMQLFKDILISLANDVNLDLADMKKVYKKAIDGYNKLDETTIEWQLELIKIQMFCTMYMNCYDQLFNPAFRQRS